MNQDDLRKLTRRTAAKASAIAKERAVRAPRAAEPAKTATTAQPAPVPPKATARPPLRAVEPSNVVPIPPKKRARVTNEILASVRSIGASRRQAQDRQIRAAKDLYKPAEPPPGVLPKGKTVVAMDAAPGVGWAGDWVVQAGYFEGTTFLGYPILAELANRTEYRKVSERLSTEMTRKWMELTSTSDEDKTDLIKEIDDWLKEMKLRQCAEKIAFVDGTMGRAHLFLDTGDDSPAELKQPIGDGRNKFSVNKVDPKKPIKRLQVVDPTWTYPAAYNAINPTKPDWLNPETWYVMGTEYHRSRLLPFIGRPVPDLYKPAFSFGGLALSQMMKSYVDNWTSTRQHIARLVGNFSRSGLRTDLQQQLAPSPAGAVDGAMDLMNRIELYNYLADNNGLMVLDKEGEEFFQFNTPLGTLDALQAQSLEQICLPAGMPVVVFLGLTPKGLNASSEGEIQAWEMWVNAYQEYLFGDMVRRMINFAQLSLRGKVDPSIGYKWLPLRTMSDKDVADLQKAKADRDAAYVDRGVLDPLEVRRALKADPMSGYTSIDAEDLPERPENDDGGGESDADGKQEEGGENAVLPFAADRGEWDESKHPRVQGGEHAGEFAAGSGAGAAAGGGVDPAKFKSKREAITHLLSRGTTQAEILKVTGWPSVSVPQQAAASGMKLEKFKEGGVTKYRGVPMTEDELDAMRQERAEKRAAKLKALGKTPGLRGPKARDPQTFSLLEFLSDRGGLKPTPDLKQIFGGTNPFVPGFGRLFRKDGMTLDNAREAAVESGYFDDAGRHGEGLTESTINHLLDAIDGESRGQKLYRLGESAAAAGGKGVAPGSREIDPEEEAYAMESALDEALHQVGITPADVDRKTRNRVVQIMRHEGESDPIAAWERAVMEEDQHGADEGRFPEREDVVAGWDVPDDLGPTLAPSEGTEGGRRDQDGGRARKSGKGDPKPDRSAVTEAPF